MLERVPHVYLAARKNPCNPTGYYVGLNMHVRVDVDKLKIQRRKKESG
jgi:hypothetical protein